MLQAVDEAAVTGAAHAAGGGDADDPETAEIALAIATIAVREASRAHQCNLGLLAMTMFGAVIAASPVKDAAAGLGAGGAADEAWPSASPDGRLVAYVAREPEARTRLLVRRLDGSGDRILLASGEGEHPVW